MLKIMSLKRRVMLARKEREREASRLKGTREPIVSSDDLLARHKNEPLVLIKFRETETLKEKSILLPVGVHLKELQKQACLFFGYPVDKHQGVKLGYPNDGIERYDQEGDSILRNLDNDIAVQQVIKHWNSGVSARRDATLVHLTLHSSYNIANPTRASDVLVGARLLFEMTEVPTNIHSIERLGQIEAIDKAPGVLLSTSVDTWVSAGAHLHWHLSADSQSYQKRNCVARKNPEMAQQAAVSLNQALEAETAALSQSKHGNKAGAEKIMKHARKMHRRADSQMSRSVHSPPTMFKMMKVLSLVCHMRRKRLGPPARLLPGAIEPGIEDLFDPEERLAREIASRRIQNLARSKKARQEVEKRRRKRRCSRLDGGSVSSVVSMDDDSDDSDDDSEDGSVSTYDSLAYTNASWLHEPSPFDDDDEHHDPRTPIHMWTASRITNKFKKWHNNAKHTIITWKAMVNKDPSAFDLMLFFVVGGIWMNLRDTLTRKVHGVEAAKHVLQLATTAVPLSRAERASISKQAKFNNKAAGVAAAFSSGVGGGIESPKSGGGGLDGDSRPTSPLSPKLEGHTFHAPLESALKKSAVHEELAVLVGYQKRLQGISMHMLCYLIKISEPIRMSLAKQHHILCLFSHTFSFNNAEQRAVQMAAMTCLARMVQETHHRERYSKKDLSEALWDTAIMGLRFNFHPSNKEKEKTQKDAAQNEPHSANGGGEGDSSTANPPNVNRSSRYTNIRDQAKKSENHEIEHALLMAVWGMCHALEQIPDIPPKLHRHHQKKHKKKHKKKHHHKHHKSSKHGGGSVSSHETHATGSTHRAALQTKQEHPAVTVAQSILESMEVIPTVLSTMLAQTQPPQPAGKSFPVSTKSLFAEHGTQNLLDVFTHICGWTRDFGFPPETQRASLSILTVCAAAAPALVAIRLGVPGLTRLLMFASGQNSMTNNPNAKLTDEDMKEIQSDYTNLTPQGHVEQQNIIHNLRIQEAAIAALGHLSKAAGNAAKNYKPKVEVPSNQRPHTPNHGAQRGGGRATSPHTPNYGSPNATSRGDNDSDASPSSVRSNMSLTGKLKSAGVVKSANHSKLSGLATKKAVAALDEKSNDVKLVIVFRRFVDEVAGVEKLSNLRKSWERKAKYLFAELDKHYPKTPMKVDDAMAVAHAVQTAKEKFQHARSSGTSSQAADQNSSADASAAGTSSIPLSMNTPAVDELKAEDSASEAGSTTASSAHLPNQPPPIDTSAKSNTNSSSSKKKSPPPSTPLKSRFSADTKNKHRGIVLDLKLKVFRGMLQTSSLIIVNLSSLPEINEEDMKQHIDPNKSAPKASSPSSPQMGTNGKPMPFRSARGKALLKKLQGAVSPRDRVKKVIEMLWSDKRSIAEQGCAALWLLARDKGPRAVVVDLCLQSSVFGGVLPIVPRLHALVTASPNLGLRTWSLSALWMLCEDERFRNQPGPFILEELVPLLIRHIVEYAPIFVTNDDDGDEVNMNGNLFTDEDDEEDNDNHHPASNAKRNNGKENDDNSDSESSDSDSGSSDSEGDSGDDEEGMDKDEVIATQWKASDLKHHCERQRLAGVSLGCLLQLTHFHPNTKALLQKDPNHMGLEAALVTLLERKATINGLKRSAYHLLFLICANHPSSMARLLCTVTEMLPNAHDINNHERDLEILLREHTLNNDGSNGGKNGAHGNFDGSVFNPIPEHQAASQNGGGGSAVGGSSFMHGSLTEGSQFHNNNMGSIYPEHCLYLEHAALGLLNAPYDNQKKTSSHDLKNASLTKTTNAADKIPRPTTRGGIIGKRPPPLVIDPAVEKEEKRRRAEAGCAALAAAEALVLGQFSQAPPKLDAKNKDNEEADAAKGDGTADEDDAALCFAMAALVDLSARRDVSKAAVVARGGAKLAVKYFRTRPSISTLSKHEMIAIITSNSNAMRDVKEGELIAQAVSGALTAGNGGTEMKQILGVWKRIYPLHLILNVSSLDICRFKTCVASFEDLIIATRGPKLSKNLAKKKIKAAKAAIKNKNDPKKDTVKDKVSDAFDNRSAVSSLPNSSIHNPQSRKAKKQDAAAAAAASGGVGKLNRKSSTVIRTAKFNRLLEEDSCSDADYTSSDDSLSSESDDNEDGADTWGRQLAFGALANLSRSMECRQRIFKHALGSGLLPPGVMKKPEDSSNQPGRKTAGVGGGALNSGRLLTPLQGRRPLRTQAPPSAIYLGVEMADAMKSLKIGKKDDGLSKVQTSNNDPGEDGNNQERADNKTFRPATTGGVGRKRSSDLAQIRPAAYNNTGQLLAQWNKESKMKSIQRNLESLEKAAKKSKKDKKLLRAREKELKAAYEELAQSKEEKEAQKKKSKKILSKLDHKGSSHQHPSHHDEDDSSTIASEHVVGGINLPPKPNSNFMKSNGGIDNEVVRITDSDGNIYDDEMDTEISMSTIDAASTEYEHLNNVMAWMFSSQNFPKPKGAPRRVAVKVPDNIPSEVSGGDDDPAARFIEEQKARLHSPNNGRGGGQKVKKQQKGGVLLGSLSRVGQMDHSDENMGLAAARRGRRSTGGGGGSLYENNSYELEETIEVYPSGSDAWHPSIAAAALKSNHPNNIQPMNMTTGMSASSSLSVASTMNDVKKKKAAAAAAMLMSSSGSGSQTLDPNKSINMNATLTLKPRKPKGAELAVDPRHTRKQVAVVLSPRNTDGNRFLWGHEEEKKETFNQVGGNDTTSSLYMSNQQGGFGTTNFATSTMSGLDPKSRSINMSTSNFNGMKSSASRVGFDESVVSGGVGGGMTGGGATGSRTSTVRPHTTMNSTLSHRSTGNVSAALNSTIPSAFEVHEKIKNAAASIANGVSIGNITGEHTVAAPGQPASSGRIWMWPHVEGSRVGYDAGLVPFRVQGPPNIGVLGGDNSSQSYAATSDPLTQEPVTSSSTHGFHFFHRPNASAMPFPAPPLPRPLPPTDLGRIFQMNLPSGKPPLIPSPDMGGEADVIPLGGWALMLDHGHMQPWTKPPPWILPVPEHSELTPVKVGDRIIDGGIPLTPAYLLAQAPPKDVVVVNDPLIKEHIPSHRLKTSVWFDRPNMNDGRDYMDSVPLYKKALNRDWRRLLNEDRFFKFVDREDDHAVTEEGKETVEDEMDEVKEVLFEWAGPLLRMFDYYCLLGSATTNTNDNGAFAISENSYHSMCNDLNLLDKKKTTKAFLSNVFVQVNVEVDDGKQDKLAAAQNFFNEDRALMRFEYLEALVRIAVNKYKAEANGDVSEALEMLFDRHVGPFFSHRASVDDDGSIFDPELIETGSVGSNVRQVYLADSVEQLRSNPIKKCEATGRASQNLFIDPNTWRATSLYHFKVDDMLKSHQKTLELIFQYYSRYDMITRGGVTQKSKSATFTLHSWMNFLDDCKLIQNNANSNPWGNVLSQREARLVFFLSRLNVVDEVKHRGRLTSLDILEFFEALCRVSEILADTLPLAEDLLEKDCKDVIEYEQLLKLEAAKSKPGTAGGQGGSLDGGLGGGGGGGGSNSRAVSRRGSKKEQQRRHHKRRGSKTSDESDGSYSGSDGEGSRGSMFSDEEEDFDEENETFEDGGKGDLDLDSLTESAASRRAKKKEKDSEEYALKEKYVNRPLYQRLEMLIRVIGGKLGMQYGGQLSVNRTVLKFVPRYIADPATLKVQQ